MGKRGGKKGSFDGEKLKDSKTTFSFLNYLLKQAYMTPWWSWECSLILKS